MHKVETEGAPTPRGHYSQGVVYRGTVWVAGQVPLDPADPEAPAGDLETQVRQVLANVEAVLEAGGSSLSRLLQVTVFVADASLWGEVNRVYAEVLGDHRPARAVIPCGPLPRGYLLEMTAVGAVADEG